MRETRNLLNLHWLFCLRISAKSWTTFCRDRIAPDCPIRHPVWPIVALQRRTRFSARLAGFYRITWHQRRARRTERASFSVFVSNPDFRVPRLRPIGERTLTGPCGGGKKGHLRGPNQGRDYRGVAALARSGPGAARASSMSIIPQAWVQVSFIIIDPAGMVPLVALRRTKKPGSARAGTCRDHAINGPRSWTTQSRGTPAIDAQRLNWLRRRRAIRSGGGAHPLAATRRLLRSVMVGA